MSTTPATPSVGASGRGHSEDYFGDYRDFWWNADFVALMARRLGLPYCRRAGVDFSRDEALELFTAGGGDARGFDMHWQRELGRRERTLEQLRTGRFDCAGGVLMYLVSGRKGRPAGPPGVSAGSGHDQRAP